MTDHKALFSPTTLGPLKLKHRVIMAPLTRSRSLQPDSVPGDLMREYYEQRASDGGLIISEATNISLTSRGWLGAPGLYSDQQVKGWKEVVSAVNAGRPYVCAALAYRVLFPYCNDWWCKPRICMRRFKILDESERSRFNSRRLGSAIPSPSAYRVRD